MGSGFQDGSPIRLTAAHVRANVTLCERHYPLPLVTQKANNSCIFYSRAVQWGIHRSIISQNRLSLSSMMYAWPWYLPQQSPDCFDIFISMSSIINHPWVEVRPIPSLFAASDYRWKTKLSDASATCLRFRLRHFFLPFGARLKLCLCSNIITERNTVYIVLCK